MIESKLKPIALQVADWGLLHGDFFDFHEVAERLYKTLNWRKGNDVIAKGNMVQFMVQNGVYAYARQHEGKTVFVMLNGTDAETTVPLKFYKEILKDSKQKVDILSGKTVTFGESLTMGPRESLSVIHRIY